LFALVKNYCILQGLNFTNICLKSKKDLFLVLVSYYMLRSYTAKPTHLALPRGVRRFQERRKYQSILINSVGFKRSRLKLFLLRSVLLNLKLKKKTERTLGLSVAVFFKNLKWSLKHTNRNLNRKVLKTVQNTKFRDYPLLKDAVLITNLSVFSKEPDFLSTFLVKELCKPHKKKNSQKRILLFFFYLLSILCNVRIELCGARVEVSGRIEGKRRKKTIRKDLGPMPLHNLSADIRYSLSEDYAAHGMLSTAV
jgi:hypothetical protein